MYDPLRDPRATPVKSSVRDFANLQFLSLASEDALTLFSKPIVSATHPLALVLLNHVWERTMNTGTVIVIIGAIIVIAIIVALAYSQKNESRKLRTTFGPEYDRVLGEENGNRTRAEAILRKRMRRIGNLDIRKPSPEASSRFAAQWRGIQELFVEDPRGAILLADSLVGEAITARGYPAADFEQRASDLSVKHPQLVADYRIAHNVAMHSQNGASTEDLRKAMQHYRDCLENILEIHIPKREEVHQ